MQFEINSNIDFFLLNKKMLKGERKEERRTDRSGFSMNHIIIPQKQEPKAVIIPLTEKYERKMGENYDHMNNI